MEYTNTWRGQLHFIVFELSISYNTDIHICVISIQKETSSKNVYTILNRIKFIIWTICAFRVLNPRQ